MVYTWHDQAKTRGGDEDDVGQVEWSSAGGRTCAFIEVWQFGPQNCPGGQFLGLGLKTKVGELSEAKRPKNVPRHVAKRFRWFGPQKHQGGGFPGFGLKEFT